MCILALVGIDFGLHSLHLHGQPSRAKVGSQEVFPSADSQCTQRSR